MDLWVSAELNGVVVRHVKRFLGSQVYGGGDFFVLVLPKGHSQGIFNRKSVVFNCFGRKSFAEIAENNMFNASDYHRICFCKVV